MIFHLTNPAYEVNLIAFEEKVGKFDTTYFGFIKIMNYRTWAYFTKTQVEHLKAMISLKQISEGLKNYTSGVQFSKKKAHEEKYYLNTWLFKAVTYYSPERIKRMPSSYLGEYILRPWKNNPAYAWYLSDREEVIFKEQVKVPQKIVEKFRFSSSVPEILHHVTNLNELCLKLIPEGSDATFFKEFKLFFSNNKLRHERGVYEINQRLINTCLFLKMNFTFSEVKNFKTYLRLISFTFKNYSCFKYFLEGKYLPEWNYCFKTLQGKSKVQTYLGWQFYASRIQEMMEVLQKLETLNLPFHKHDSPLYAYNFYSKRYAQDSGPDFPLLNPNRSYCHERGEDISLSKDFSQIKLKDFKVELVNTWHELIEVGIKLHNCAGNTEKLEDYQSCLNFMLKDDGGEVKYLGSIRKGRLTQLKGFKNSSPTMELYQALKDELTAKQVITRADKYTEACVQDYH